VLRINVYGRCVYNSVSRSVYEKDDLFWSEDNRITKRCVFKEVKNIQEAIEFKVWVDKSIMEEISYYRNAETSNIISSQTYSSYIIFSKYKFSSNLENVCFSKHGARKTKVDSLGAYSTMDYSCFQQLSNNQIKSILKGEFTEELNDLQKSHFAQVMSLFLCEASRNPEALITLPMCLEIVGKIDLLESEDKNQKIRGISDLAINSHYKPKDSEKYKEKLCKDRDELLDINSYVYSNLVGYVIKYLFPMSMQGAVTGSRYISQEIETKLQGTKERAYDFYHEYDDKPGEARPASILLSRENDIVQYYLQQTPTLPELIDLSYQWYGINIGEVDVNGD
jgi:hypothetical protein